MTDANDVRLALLALSPSQSVYWAEAGAEILYFNHAVADNVEPLINRLFKPESDRERILRIQMLLDDKAIEPLIDEMRRNAFRINWADLVLRIRNGENRERVFEQILRRWDENERIEAVLRSGGSEMVEPLLRFMPDDASLSKMTDILRDYWRRDPTTPRRVREFIDDQGQMAAQRERATALFYILLHQHEVNRVSSPPEGAREGSPMVDRDRIDKLTRELKVLPPAAVAALLAACAAQKPPPVPVEAPATRPAVVEAAPASQPVARAPDTRPIEFPTPEMISVWSKSLEEARLRAELPASAAEVEARTDRRAEDIGLAGWVLGTFGSRVRPWVTMPQLVTAAEVLIAHDALVDHQRPVLINALKAGPPENVRELRRLVVRQGAAMASAVIDIYHARFDEPGGAAASSEFALQLMWELGKRDPAALEALLTICRDPTQPAPRVEAAVSLLDGVTSGKVPLPLPAGSFEAWLKLVETGVSGVPAAATDALIRHPDSGYREDDRAALYMLNYVKSRYAMDLGEAEKFLPKLKPGAAQALVLGTLIENLNSPRQDFREATAKLLSQWPQPEEASLAVAKFVVSEPLGVTSDGKLGADPKVMRACVDWLIRGGPKSVAAAPVLAAAMSDPDRAEWAERVLDAIGPDAVRPLLTAYTDTKEIADSDPLRLKYVRVIGQRSMAGSAAEYALLQILADAWASESIRREAILGLAHASNDLPAVRKALIPELRSDKVPLRLAAAATLAAIKPGDDADLSIAIDWIKTGDGPHRVAGARLLAAAGPRTADAAIPPLLRMSDNICSIQRGTAATALAAINPDGSKLSAAVVASVYHHDAVMRSHLLAAAKKAGDEKLVERLKDLAANEPDPQVREAAKQTLSALK